MLMKMVLVEAHGVTFKALLVGSVAMMLDPAKSAAVWIATARLTAGLSSGRLMGWSGHSGIRWRNSSRLDQLNDQERDRI